MKMRKAIVGLLAAAFIIPTAGLSVSAATVSSDVPQVDTSAKAPSSPDSDFYPNLNNISFTYEGVRYWVFDDSQNPWPGVMLIGAYDINKKLLGTCEVTGARYLSSITVDTGAQTVTFNGQGSSSMTWEDLEKLAAPQVDTSAKAPSSPDSDFYANLNNISFTYKGVRYWVFDDRENPWPGVMLIGAYDLNNNLLGSCEVTGARYLDSITVDSDAKTVTFNGQGTSSISWGDLEKLPVPTVSTTAKAPSSPSSDYYVNLSNISFTYKGIRYWVFDNLTNPWPGVMLVGAYDSNNNLLGSVEVTGARYLSSITVDSDAKTVTFNGQGTSSMSWYALDALANK